MFWAQPDGEVDAYWIPDAGYVDDPQLAAHNLAHAAASAGARFRFNTEVTEVLRGDPIVTGLAVAGREALNAPVVVNAAGPWSGTLNRLAGVLDDFTTSTRPLEQEVISLPAPGNFRPGHGGVCVADADFGTYYRPHAGQTLIVGGMEPECDPLVWLDRPEDARTGVSRETWEVQSMRVARRMPNVRIPPQSRGIVGVYDVTDDWIPIYDRTTLAGYYVAIRHQWPRFQTSAVRRRADGPTDPGLPTRPPARRRAADRQRIMDRQPRRRGPLLAAS